MLRKDTVRIFLLVMVISWSSSVAMAQKKAWFTGDSVRFVTELETIFANIADNEQKIIKPGIADFLIKWNKNEFGVAEKGQIIRIMNEMVGKKIRPFPDFYGYIRSLNVFLDTRQPAGHFETWSAILLKLIGDKNSRKFLSYLESTSNLFADSLVYKSNTTRWKIRTSSFVLGMDTVPWIRFPKSDLVCFANDDSLNIHETSGTYYPLTNLWKGHKGKVNWERAGEDPSKIHADLATYEIQMRFSKFTADSARFTHKKYFPAPIYGRYVDKVLADVTEEKASYPRFYSYDKMIGIPRLFKNIDYLGGFAMEGSRIIGSGDRSIDARLFFKRDGKDFVIARSKTFIIRPDRINSSNSSVTIYHETDSIFHPGLQLKYLDKDTTLSFSKDERVVNISPWFDSFHKIEIYCEALNWKVGDAKINFEMTKGISKESKAVFESSSYYSLHRYEKLRGIDDVNPLNLIKYFTDKRKSREFTLEELARYMNKPVEQVEVQLLNMANRGFLVYDYDDKIARVKDKLYSYVNARDGKADYDVIFFNSFVTNTANGILNLETFDLKIQGVPVIALSDSQQVRVYPKNSEVVLKKDMDFVFSGKMEAGLFDFYTRDASFEYNRFRINLPNVDSMTFYVRSKKWDPATNSFPLVKVRTAITNLSGDLLIDQPDNKSGLKSLKDYPVFTNRSNSFVYWNKNSIQKGVYNKDKFFFEVQPFVIHSLDVVATDSLNFTGALTSANIFPTIAEPLKVRPDFSLGLEKATDSAGLPVYGGKGQFFANIDLSDRGLRGDGILRYLNSTTRSTDFLFLPDSMKTMAREFSMTEVLAAVEYPQVHGDSVTQFWLPYRDSLIVSSNRKDLAMYNDQSTFSGSLALTPRLLSGSGTVKIKDAEMDSKGFSFKRRTFDALIANFRIKSYDLADLTISTRNYQTHFDFDQRKGEFKSNVGISKVEFPINKYVCSMDRFDWLIDTEEILLANEQSRKTVSDTLSLTQLIDQGYTGSEFISVHPLQDSLKFFAAKARYHLRTNVINAEEVKIIKVADAAVYPDSGKVQIFKDARMETLRHAILIANTKSRHHQFYNADVSVSSRKNYTGRGDYDYVDRTGSRQQIRFSQIRVDTAGQTVANGAISDSARFTLSPEFAFRGEVDLEAATRELLFEGGFHPISECLTTRNEWVKFSGRINPSKVRIPVVFPLKNINGEPVNLGMMFLNNEVKISPSFFRKKLSFSDTTIVTAQGFIEYNIPTTEFRIATPEKLDNLAGRGNFFALNNSNCMVRGEGKLNLSMNSEHLKLESYGTFDYYLIPDSARIHMAVAFNFPFSEEGLQKFSNQVESINLTGVNLARTPYAMAMDNLLGKEDAERLKGEMDLIGKYRKFPEQLERTMFLADVWMRWDSSLRSYVSYGNIGIANIGKNQVNKYVKGIIEFTKKKNGDDFTIYLELTRDEWYFFNYRGKTLVALSSDLAFNDIIRAAAQSRPEQKRVGNLAKGFVYSLATDRKKRDFLRKFQAAETE